MRQTKKRFSKDTHCPGCRQPWAQGLKVRLWGIWFKPPYRFIHYELCEDCSERVFGPKAEYEAMRASIELFLEPSEGSPQ